MTMNTEPGFLTEIMLSERPMPRRQAEQFARELTEVSGGVKFTALFETMINVDGQYCAGYVVDEDLMAQGLAEAEIEDWRETTSYLVVKDLDGKEHWLHRAQIRDHEERNGMLYVTACRKLLSRHGLV